MQKPCAEVAFPYRQQAKVHLSRDHCVAGSACSCRFISPDGLQVAKHEAATVWYEAILRDLQFDKAKLPTGSHGPCDRRLQKGDLIHHYMYVRMSLCYIYIYTN